MDGGGLNGSMMDPMRMSDAELLEPPPAPAATAPTMGEKTSDEVKTNNSAEFKAMEEKVKSAQIDKEKMVTEIYIIALSITLTFIIEPIFMGAVKDLVLVWICLHLIDKPCHRSHHIISSLDCVICG